MRMRGHERITLENDKCIYHHLFQLTHDKGNPSLRIMEQIADALDKSLPEFLEETDQDSKSLEALAGSKLRGIAENYECTS